MSGHSKWATTKRAKAVVDAKRSAVFTKLAKLVTVSARTGADPATNFNLRLAIEKARSANMPKENIERAIKKGSGELGASQIEEVLYEAYGPHGTAILIEVLTDNKNRALSEIKAVLNKLGGKLANAGSVSYLFHHRGFLKVLNGGLTDEEIELTILDSPVEDYEKEGSDFIIYSKPEELMAVKDSLEKSGLMVESAELVYEPKNSVVLNADEEEKVIKLLETIDDLDDVAAVHSNLG